jgi:uncharacterized OB-fold protein
MQDCPNCISKGTMLPDRVPGNGALQDFVVAERGPVGFHTPYVQAYVKLDSGPVIYGNLDVADPDDEGIAAGRRVTMHIGVISTHDGVDVIGWMFRLERAV